ncbi:MAG: hypothetical protein MR455_06175 [Prevotella sp.]|nr:hypothetical protein [Prevotella sp.]
MKVTLPSAPQTEMPAAMFASGIKPWRTNMAVVMERSSGKTDAIGR